MVAHKKLWIAGTRGSKELLSAPNSMSTYQSRQKLREFLRANDTDFRTRPLIPGKSWVDVFKTPNELNIMVLLEDHRRRNYTTSGGPTRGST